MTDFPEWGFMVTGLRLSSLETASYKRHLFLNENETACGWKPKSRYRHYTFSTKPIVPGIYEVMSEMERGRLYSADDFPKCKRCLKSEEKSNER